MKVKLPYNFNYIDDDGVNGIATITFEKDTLYNVIHTFRHDDWNNSDSDVYVIMNNSGETMSISSDIVQVVNEHKRFWELEPNVEYKLVDGDVRTVILVDGELRYPNTIDKHNVVFMTDYNDLMNMKFVEV